MRVVCCICSDVLEDASSASSTPCGHVYHSNCLMSWLNRSETCPDCRNRVIQETVSKLYFNVPSTTALHHAKLENELSEVKSQLNVKTMELNACQAALEESDNNFAQMEEAFNKCKTKIAELKFTVTMLKLSNSFLSCMLAMNAKENNLTEKDDDKKQEECGSGSDETTQMTFTRKSIKQELDKIIKSNAKGRKRNSKRTENNYLFVEKVEFYEALLNLARRNADLPEAGPSQMPDTVVTPNADNTGIISQNATSNTGNFSSENTNSSSLSTPFVASNIPGQIQANVGNTENLSNIAGMTSTNEGDTSVIRTGYNLRGRHINFINTASTSGVKMPAAAAANPNADNTGIISQNATSNVGNFSSENTNSSSLSVPFVASSNVPDQIQANVANTENLSNTAGMSSTNEEGDTSVIRAGYNLRGRHINFINTASTSGVKMPASVVNPKGDNTCIISQNAISNTGNFSCENTNSSPLPVPMKKSKFHMHSVASSNVPREIQVDVANTENFSNTAGMSSTNGGEDTSVIRTGYNLRGGCTNFIGTASTSGVKKLKNLKRKL